MNATKNSTAFVLLHGIGAQSHTRTIRDFLACIDPNDGDEASRELHLRRPSKASGNYAYVSAEHQDDNSRIVVSEYFWADLSRIKTGFLSILRNFFSLVADAPDIIYACLGPNLSGETQRDYVVLKVLRCILALSIWLIYFPIVALNCAYGVFVLDFAVRVRYDASTTLDTPADVNVLSAGLAGLVFLGLVKYFGRPGAYISSLLAFIAAFIAGVTALAAYNLAIDAPSAPYSAYADIFNNGLNALWLLVAVGSLLYLALLPLLMVFFKQRRRGLLLGFAVMWVVTRFWLVLITTVWLAILTTLYNEATYASLVEQIGGPIRFLSIFWLEIAIIALAFGYSLAAFSLHPRDLSETPISRTYPRLIAPVSFPYIAIMLSLLGIAAIVACSCSALVEECKSLNCQIVDMATNWIVANAATILFFGTIAVQFAHKGFEPVLDIVNFFKTDGVHRKMNPLAALTSAWSYSPDESQQFRGMLGDRLVAQMNDLSTRFGPFDRIVFVAHSLGSMMALDFINSGHRHDNQPSRVELITMGSPFAHIFMYYMPHMFPSAAAFAERHDLRWSNLYRVDDYVGTWVTDQPNERIEEIPLPPKGHLGYFSDQQVGEIIRDRHG